MTTLTPQEIKAAQAANSKAAKALATKVAKTVVKDAPAHTFSTGSEGRNVQANVEVDGRPAYVQVRVVFRDTVKKAEAAAPKAARKPKVSLVKETAPAAP
jgi:hypothetical protein